ncbi:MAG: 4'-phosphopantetheinyl transferase family protein [Lachnospiraceae bacterium]
MICYIVQQRWTSAVSEGNCAFSNRQPLLERGFQEAFHVSVQDLHFTKGPHGKPQIADHPEMNFNITHTSHRSFKPGKYYMAGAFCNCPVGIDCEYPRRITQRLYDRTLSPGEKALFQTSSCPEILFLRYWTLKESYLKYTGEGLSCNPAFLCFLPDTKGNYVLEGHPDLHFLQFDLPDGLILSLCTEKPCQVEFITLK